ncbi:hypothetical protein ElyMa_001608700 [Elysia marginata]|uniref:Uncharacterized protein n=1 Tax=Elysia marginata TaxID=1093978 RepID=A0AAV4JNE1_9GAST|nr:hypothetical protein ElyMa_001608700 [Elysia marginata]
MEQYRERMTYLPEPEYNTFRCVGAMTYIDTYKTVITQSLDYRQETLCWMIIDDKTIVVVNTSSCNMQTANGITRRDPRYMVHLKWQLNLGAAGPELNRLCLVNLETRERNWRARLAQQMEDLQEGKRGASKGGKDSATTLSICLVGGIFRQWAAVISLTICAKFIEKAVVK